MARSRPAGPTFGLCASNPPEHPGRRGGRPGQGLRHPHLRHQGRGQRDLLPAHPHRPRPQAAHHDGRRRRPGHRSSTRKRHGARWHGIIGGTEETTTGVIRLRAMEKDGVLQLSRHRRQRRRRPSTSSTTATARARAPSTASSARRTSCWPARKVVVAGYGWCGQGVGHARPGAWARSVIVTEVDPLKALEAVMDGFRSCRWPRPPRSATSSSPSPATSTSSTRQHFELMKDGAIVANTGHFNVEIDIPAPGKAVQATKQARPRVRR